MARIASRPQLVELLLLLLAREEVSELKFGAETAPSIEAKRQIARILFLLSGSYPQLLRPGVPLLRTCRSTADSDPRLLHFAQLALRNLEKGY